MTDIAYNCVFPVTTECCVTDYKFPYIINSSYIVKKGFCSLINKGQGIFLVPFSLIDNSVSIIIDISKIIKDTNEKVYYEAKKIYCCYEYNVAVIKLVDNIKLKFELNFCDNFKEISDDNNVFFAGDGTNSNLCIFTSYCSYNNEFSNRKISSIKLKMKDNNVYSKLESPIGIPVLSNDEEIIGMIIDFSNDYIFVISSRTILGCILFEINNQIITYPKHGLDWLPCTKNIINYIISDHVSDNVSDHGEGVLISNVKKNGYLSRLDEGHIISHIIFEDIFFCRSIIEKLINKLNSGKISDKNRNKILSEIKRYAEFIPLGDNIELQDIPSPYIVDLDVKPDYIPKCNIMGTIKNNGKVILSRIERDGDNKIIYPNYNNIKSRLLEREVCLEEIFDQLPFSSKISLKTYVKEHKNWFILESSVGPAKDENGRIIMGDENIYEKYTYIQSFHFGISFELICGMIITPLYVNYINSSFEKDITKYFKGEYYDINYCVVSHVFVGYEAWKSNIKSGDIILSINEKHVNTIDEFREELEFNINKNLCIKMLDGNVVCGNYNDTVSNDKDIIENFNIDTQEYLYVYGSSIEKRGLKSIHSNMVALS